LRAASKDILSTKTNNILEEEGGEEGQEEEERQEGERRQGEGEDVVGEGLLSKKTQMRIQMKISSCNYVYLSFVSLFRFFFSFFSF
jgi:hypothetical protein